MTPGKLARLLLGDYFPLAGRLYRRVFVDMDKVVSHMLAFVPDGATILDIGGGDGIVAELLLKHRSDIAVIIVDVIDNVGGFIGERYLDRVKICPKTSVSDVVHDFDIIIIADVLHHITHSDQDEFLETVSKLALRRNCSRIIVKDIQPGSVRAWLSLCSDHFITGDKKVSLVSGDRISIIGYSLIDTSFPDPPNYCLVFEKKQSCQEIET